MTKKLINIIVKNVQKKETKMKKNYELKNHGEISVLIIKEGINSFYYPYQPIKEYLEVSAEIDRDTLKLKKFRGEVDYSYRLMRNENDSLANWQGKENAIHYMGEAAIAAAEKQVRKNLSNIRKIMEEAKLNPVWLTLKPIADTLINHYKSDFYYHDCMSLYENKPKTFLWLVRDTGSWLLIDNRKAHKEILDHELKQGKSNIYFWNGNDLKKIKIENADYTFSLLSNPIVKVTTP